MSLAIAACAHGSDKRDDSHARYDRLAQEAGDAPCDPQPATGCDAVALACDADRAAMAEQSREALLLYEASLACKPAGDVERRAFMAACEAGDSVRVRKYFRTMTIEAEKRPLLREACMSYGVDPSPEPA